MSQKDLNIKGSTRALAPPRLQRKSRSFCVELDTTKEESKGNVNNHVLDQFFQRNVKEANEETKSTTEIEKYGSTSTSQPIKCQHTLTVPKTNLWENESDIANEAIPVKKSVPKITTQSETTARPEIIQKRLSGPRIIITQYETSCEAKMVTDSSDREYTKIDALDVEKEAGGATRSKSLLFADFNEQHTEKKKELDKRRSLNRQLEMNTMEKHPSAMKHKTTMHSKSKFAEELVKENNIFVPHSLPPEPPDPIPCPAYNEAKDI